MYSEEFDNNMSYNDEQYVSGDAQKTEVVTILIGATPEQVDYSQNKFDATVFFSLFTKQPRCLSILTAASTSVSLGQLCITLTPFTSTVAARMGRELFFEPCTSISPYKALPPLMIILSIKPPFHPFTPYYAKR